VCQERVNYWYETHQTACGLQGVVLIGKLDRYNDRKICEKLPANKTGETPVTSTCLSVDCLKIKTDRMSNKPLHNKNNGGYR
jgi:hypothetical protein